MLKSTSKRRALLFVGPIAVLLLLFAGTMALRVPSKAHASGITLYVGSFIGLNTNCSSPGFTTVQSAVDIAPVGATVYLCGTTPYAEQVVIQKSVTLTGDPGATIKAPNPFPTTSPSRLPPQFTTDNLFVPQAIVFIWGSGVNAKIKGLNITGVLPGNSTCAEEEFGVLVIDGATVTLNKDNVKDIRDSNTTLYGCQFGVAIQIGREYWPTANLSSFPVENFVGHATINGTTVSGYQKNGITVDGTGTTATITLSTVNGAGQTDTSLSPNIAQNGIQISRGAHSTVTSTLVTGNAYTGSGGASSTGILVFGGSCGEGSTTPLTTGTNVQKNTLQNNDIGVALSNLNAVGTNLLQCALPTTATNVKASSNHISNGAVTNTSGTNLFGFPGGYQAGVSDEGYADQIIFNAICGVGYTPVTPPPYLSQIDIAATNPVVSGNTTCTSSSAVNASASAKTIKKGHIRNVTSPVK